MSVTGTVAVQESGQDALASSGSVVCSGSVAAQESGQDHLEGVVAVELGVNAAAQESGQDVAAVVAYVGVVDPPLAVHYWPFISDYEADRLPLTVTPGDPTKLPVLQPRNNWNEILFPAGHARSGLTITNGRQYDQQWSVLCFVRLDFSQASSTGWPVYNTPTIFNFLESGDYNNGIETYCYDGWPQAWAMSVDVYIGGTNIWTEVGLDDQTDYLFCVSHVVEGNQYFLEITLIGPDGANYQRLELPGPLPLCVGRDPANIAEIGTTRWDSDGMAIGEFTIFDGAPIHRYYLDQIYNEGMGVTAILGLPESFIPFAVRQMAQLSSGDSPPRGNPHVFRPPPGAFTEHDFSYSILDLAANDYEVPVGIAERDTVASAITLGGANFIDREWVVSNVGVSFAVSRAYTAAITYSQYVASVYESSNLASTPVLQSISFLQGELAATGAAHTYQFNALVEYSVSRRVHFTIPSQIQRRVAHSYVFNDEPQSVRTSVTFTVPDNTVVSQSYSSTVIAPMLGGLYTALLPESSNVPVRNRQSFIVPGNEAASALYVVDLDSSDPVASKITYTLDTLYVSREQSIVMPNSLIGKVGRDYTASLPSNQAVSSQTVYALTGIKVASAHVYAEPIPLAGSVASATAFNVPSNQSVSSPTVYTLTGVKVQQFYAAVMPNSLVNKVSASYTAAVANNEGISAQMLYALSWSLVSSAYVSPQPNSLVNTVRAATSFWIPDAAKVQQFMVYATSYNAVGAPYTVQQYLSTAKAVSRPYTALYTASSYLSRLYEVPVVSAEPIGAIYDVPTEAAEKTKVNSTYRVAYYLESGETIIEGVDWRVLHNGEEVSAYSFNIKFDEGDYAWSGSISLGDYDDYAQIRKDDEILIEAGGEEYRFIVDGKNRDLGEPAQVELRVQLVSPTARYDVPRFGTITKTWEEPVMASAAAQEYLTAPLDWTTVDWEIPAFRLGVDNASAIRLVSLLAEAVSAVVETSREGDLYVRPIYYHTTEFFYEDVAPDYVIDDSIDVFTIRESYSVERLVNLIRIRDVDASYSDTLEWIRDPDSFTDGELRAFPSPYRTFFEAPVITTSEAPTVTLMPIEEVEYTIEEPELIEISDGRGNTKYPIYEIVSVEWESAPLPNIVFESGARGIRVTGAEFPYGLLRLVYKTRYHSYRVSGTIDRAAQFLMTDTSGV